MLDPFFQTPLNRAIYEVNRVFTRAFHHLTIESPCRIPPTGPAILVCNHTAHCDPIFLQASTSRLIEWMMTEEFINLRGFGWLFRRARIIPVNRRSRDTAAVKTALRRLEQGAVIGVFPEGRIEKSRQLLPFENGVAMLARRSGAPIFPAYIDGNLRRTFLPKAYLEPHDVVLRHANPIHINIKEDLDAATSRIRGAIEALKNQGTRTIFSRT